MLNNVDLKTYKRLADDDTTREVSTTTNPCINNVDNKTYKQ